jgi:hypothetical protein
VNAKWDRLKSNEDYQVLRRENTVLGWVVKIDGRWIARREDGTVRADFDTIEEARDFLQTIVGANE